MMLTPNRRPSISFTVKLTPSMQMDPLGATKRIRSSGNSNCSLRDLASSATLASVPTASTCPLTRWPPSGSPARRLGSRFTRAPLLSAPKVVFASVSRDTSAQKRVPSSRVTVRHTPCTHTLSPTAVRPEPRPAASMPSSRSPPRSAVETIRPVARMIPVNIFVKFLRAPRRVAPTHAV